MANLKAVVRKQRADGMYPVYIRIVHRRKMGYIKTDKIISPKSLTKQGDIKDAVVNEYCSNLILRYTDKINRKDISAFTMKELIEYLTLDEGEQCFSEYAQLHIRRMEQRGQIRNAKNYKLAVQWKTQARMTP